MPGDFLDVSFACLIGKSYDFAGFGLAPEVFSGGEATPKEVRIDVALISAHYSENNDRNPAIRAKLIDTFHAQQIHNTILERRRRDNVERE